jgi:hypothetical protein
MIIEVSVEQGGAEDFDEMTQIRELIAELRPAELAG